MITCILIAISSALFLWFSTLYSKRIKRYPPGPSNLPILGNTSLLRELCRQLGSQHLALSHLALAYETPILSLRLGSELVVVVFTYEVVREVLIRDEFIGRPNTFFIRLRSFGTRRGVTCTDGALWQEHRGFTVRHLRQLGFGRPVMEELILSELEELNQVFNNGEKPQYIGKQISPSVLSVLWCLTAGKRLPRTDQKLHRLLNLLDDRARAFDMAGGVLNQFPWLRFFAPKKTGYSLLLQVNEELRGFVLEVIAEHKKNFNGENITDLIDAFLVEMDARCHDECSTFTDDQLIMIILDLFIAGSQTTSNTLDFAFLLMLKYPEVQQQVFEEINQCIGTNRLPRMSDKPRMVYTEAVLLEVQRLCHVTPITGPRRVLKDTTLQGYFIPKDTTILISQWSVHRDEAIFPAPNHFLPERFLDYTRRVVSHDQLIPFGLGKRRCLGEALAKSCLFLIFTGVLQKYQITNPIDAPEPTIEPLPGITLAPRPYSAVLKLRNS